jgi:hypothetical protein
MFVFLFFQAGVECQKEFAGGCFGDDLPVYFFLGGLSLWIFVHFSVTIRVPIQ